MDLKKCTGTKSEKGCGEIKLFPEDFSKNYKSFCKQCERDMHRRKYHQRDVIPETPITYYTKIPWR